MGNTGKPGFSSFPQTPPNPAPGATFSGFPKNPPKFSPRCTSEEYQSRQPSFSAREKNVCYRTRTASKVHQSRRRPMTFIFLARASKRHFRERGRGCTSGGDFVGFSWQLENLGFQVMGNSEKLAPGAGSPTSVSQFSPSRARSQKNILAVPDGSGSPPGASGPARLFFMGRACACVENPGIPDGTLGIQTKTSEFRLDF